MNFILRRFLRYNLIKIASHRLPTHRCGAHIGNYFGDPFLFQNWNLGKTSFADDAMKQMVKFVLQARKNDEKRLRKVMRQSLVSLYKQQTIAEITWYSCRIDEYFPRLVSTAFLAVGKKNQGEIIFTSFLLGFSLVLVMDCSWYIFQNLCEEIFDSNGIIVIFLQFVLFAKYRSYCMLRCIKIEI